MLHILLLILKIIGIVLLSILGILLLGIVCALFVPVRYRIEAVRQEGEGQPPAAVRVKVTWLLHLINFLIRFDGELFVRVRISLLTILCIPQKEGRRKKAEKRESGGKKKKQKKQEEQERNKEAAPSKREEEKGRQAEATVESMADSGRLLKTGTSEENETDAAGALAPEDLSQEHREEPAEITQTLPEEERAGPVEAEEGEEEAGTQETPGFWDKLRVIPEMLQRLFEKIRGLFENIEYTINKFCDKIGSVSDTIEYYREVVEGEAFKRSFALCKDELTAIIKRLRPRKFEASLIVGMDDPASTGEILAVCGMLYPIIGGHVDVRGDFDRKRLEGEILIVGKLRMFTFLRTAVRIYFNKDIRKLYRLLKRRQ